MSMGIGFLMGSLVRSEIMTREEQLKIEYERKLSDLRAEQNRCCHEWGDVKYDPEIKKEPYGYRMVAQGSDVWGEPEGYRDVEHKRWSRTCKNSVAETHQTAYGDYETYDCLLDVKCNDYERLEDK